jgi:hypothetical protein
MNPYIVGGMGLLILIMGITLKSSITRNGELEAKLETQAAETLEATDANDSNMETITTLRGRIVTMVEERRVDTERREKILVEREAELVAARTENDTLRGEREDEQEENADCADLASLRVDFFCPATAEQLRQRSRGTGSHEDGDST